MAKDPNAKGWLDNLVTGSANKAIASFAAPFVAAAFVWLASKGIGNGNKVCIDTFCVAQTDVVVVVAAIVGHIMTYVVRNR